MAGDLETYSEGSFRTVFLGSDLRQPLGEIADGIVARSRELARQQLVRYDRPPDAPFSPVYVTVTRFGVRYIVTADGEGSDCRGAGTMRTTTARARSAGIAAFSAAAFAFTVSVGAMQTPVELEVAEAVLDDAKVDDLAVTVTGTEATLAGRAETLWQKPGRLTRRSITTALRRWPAS